MTEKNQQEQELNQSSEEMNNKTAEKEVCFDYQEIDKMMATIEEKNRLVDESTNRLKRLQADFDNFRRRTRQEKEELSNLVVQTLILELLPVLDNFERALATGEVQDAEGIKSGVEMIYRQIVGILEKNGLAPVISVGELFNPERHEAVIRVEDSEKEEGTIIEEFQKGYIVRGKVIRPSMVKVTGN
ncbi:Protein GrpE [bioreactor metagenome]|uniref:Protein GrpE n=1 Tax=bioreactor metagenome TaxID=1076179 RepID=A0A644T943_9ZZZZ|nr:nucleotide exchange factor GrpE [Negativicutes bacterium]